MVFIYQLKDIQTIAKEAISHFNHKIVLFNAPMGAGKTTFIKAIANALNIEDLTSSPTFSIVNEYRTPNSGESLYHFDLYRLNDEEEAYDFGFEEYLYSNNWCLIEWPEKTPNLIPEEHTLIEIEIIDDLTRKLIITNM